MPNTTAYKRGTVVLLPFPFSDQSSAKVRPGIIASPRYPSDDLLVIGVSSVAGNMRPGEFSIRNWRDAGLLHASFVKRAVATVACGLIRRELGRLSEEDITKMDVTLRLWFAL